MRQRVALQRKRSDAQDIQPAQTLLPSAPTFDAPDHGQTTLAAQTPDAPDRATALAPGGYDISTMSIFDADGASALQAGPLLQRKPAAADPAPPAPAKAGADASADAAKPLPSADELATRIANCIGIWETNRGHDEPAPKESSLDTVAGVHASMATVEQATMTYAISALKAHKSLREKADPPLTLKELNAAEGRCKAVTKLLGAVSDAAAKSTAADDFIAGNAALIAETGLADDDVKTMFSAVTLKSTIDTARADVAAKKTTVKDAVAAIPAADRLGLGAGSISAYIKKEHNWGEHRAGWQRKAVEAMGDNVAVRIQGVAVSDKGTALAVPVVKGRVDTQLAKQPPPNEETIVKTVAQQNNPGEPDYGENVWKTYKRLYP